jgi:hypothetical protein
MRLFFGGNIRHGETRPAKDRKIPDLLRSIGVTFTVTSRAVKKGEITSHKSNSQAATSQAASRRPNA